MSGQVRGRPRSCAGRCPRWLRLRRGSRRRTEPRAGLLLVGQQICPGLQGPSGGVERVGLAAPVPAGVELDSPPALVECVAGQPHHVEGVHDRDRVGHFLGGGGLEPGESIHGNDFHSVAPRFGAVGKPGLERSFAPPFDHVEQPRRAGLGVDRGQVDDDRDVFVAAAGMAPHVFIDANDRHPVEAARIIDQQASSFGEHRIVGGVPRHRQRFSDPRHAEVLAHNGFQRPPQPTPRQLGTRLSRATQVLAPHVRTAPAPVTADRDQQRGRTPPEGSWASWRVTLSRALPCSPQRRHHESSLVIRHANTARSACTRCPVTSNPSSSRRQKAVRSGQPKPSPGVASGTSRSSR